MANDKKLTEDQIEKGVKQLLLESKINRNRTIKASAVFDPASIAAGAFATTTVSVPGALIGDFVKATFSLSLAGIKPLSAVINAADVATIYFENPTGGAINLGSGTVNVRVDQLK